MKHGATAKGPKDCLELLRRIAFSILISNTDDHLRNHGFFWQGRRGWALSPCYDLNPVPDAPRILKTRIDFEDGTASLRLLGDVAEYFGTQSVTDDIIRQCVSVTKNWKQYAQRRHAPQGEIARMIPAFEHEDLEYAPTI